MTSTATSNAILDAALPLYARDGVRVFPVNPKSKRPLIADWPNAATTDESASPRVVDRVTHGDDRGCHGAGSGFWALDIDPKPGKDGFASLAALEAKHGARPQTFRATTPSGGEHYYFRYPEGARLRSRAGDIAPGIDTRGGRADGSSTGYVSLPPSTRADGKSYQAAFGSDLLWEIGSGLPGAPAWLLFVVIFSRRQRDQLVKVGIADASAFNDAQPSEWLRLADEALGIAFSGAQSAPSQPLDTKTSDLVLNYISSAINKEIEAIPAAGNGEQERTLNNAGLAIHSLISGAKLRGVDAQALAEIETKAGERYCAAAIALPAFKLGDPWTKEQVSAKWRHTQEDAEPRNFWHVGASDVDSEFRDCIQSELEKDVERLAGLPPLEYDRVRTEAAERLNVRVGTLDDEVKAKRREVQSSTEQSAFMKEPAAWPAPVDGAQLLSRLVSTIKAHVVMPDYGAEAAALWVLHAHAHDAAEISPILAIESPEKRCGKTTAMNVLGELVPKKLSISNITPASLFRCVEKFSDAPDR